MDVARAVEVHRSGDLGFEVTELRDGRGGHVGDLRRAIAISGALLPWPKELPGCPPRGSVVAVRAAWRRAGALDTGVHVALVVVADVEHVVAALEHPQRHAKPMSTVPPSPP